MQHVNALKQRWAELTHVRKSISVLSWDQQAYMPPGGARARSNQIGTLSKIHHQMLTADETAKLIETAAQEVAGMDEDGDEASIVRVAKRDYERATQLPTEFVAEFARTTTFAHGIWVEARENNDFEHFRPSLEKIYDLCKQRAEYTGYQEHIYDAMIDRFEIGMTTKQVETLFDGLRKELVPLALAILEREDQVSDEPLRRYYPKAKQAEFSLMVAEKIGYDLKRGRLDTVVHPFCISFSQNDVRITTRYDEHHLNPAFFGTVHETGHASYEQGIHPDYEETPLSGGTSLGIHESQSRLWENVVGRSRGFWEYFYPQLQAVFPDTLTDVSCEAFYQAVNKVERSFIRVEADEVTYPLHIMLRFEIEKDIMTDKLAVKDAPEAWKAKFQEYLGVTPPNDREGVLQDVHWSEGIMGYFPTYALGTMLSAQLYERVLQDHPDVPSEIRQGKFETLMHWMNTHIHIHGRKYLPAELIQRATGQPLQHHAFMRYLRGKFGEIYGV